MDYLMEASELKGSQIHQIKLSTLNFMRLSDIFNRQKYVTYVEH